MVERVSAAGSERCICAFRNCFICASPMLLAWPLLLAAPAVGRVLVPPEETGTPKLLQGQRPQPSLISPISWALVGMKAPP